MDLSFLSDLLATSLTMTTPILFAAIGETFTERSGVLNLGIEGLMATGAFMGLWFTFISGSLWIGVLGAIVACLLLTLIMGVVCIRIGVHQVIGGLLLLMLGDGISRFGFQAVTSAGTYIRIQTFPAIIFGQSILVFLALFLAVVAGLILFKTSAGLKIRAVGENPRASDTVGINVNRVRFICLLFGGAMAGIGGATLTIGILGHFGEGMIAGRGWLAIIVVILSRWNPTIAIGGSFLFGFAYSLAARLIVLGLAQVSYHFLLMLPYLLAIITILFVYRRARPPAGLLIPYRRE